MVINIFCDASIDLDKKVACGGAVFVMQEEHRPPEQMGFRRVLQLNATNNSAEILAIWIGVVEALKLRQLYPNAVFRLFSDSKISIYGLRDWIKAWVARITPEGILVSSSGQPVLNQQRFIEIFNLIVENNLKIELYHQRGHVYERHMPLLQARAQFIKANKVAPEGMGTTIDQLCKGNDIVDHITRDAVRAYLDHGTILPYTDIEGPIPFEYDIRKNHLHQYIRNIDKTSVYSRHDFKGGYNQ